MKKEKQWIMIIIVLLVISLVSGGTSAILLIGLAFEIIYAIHKISSVIFAVLLVIYFVRQRKG
jgi:uncharacterized membrane protein